ncbi:putative F-box protein At3g16210 [Andrographis paniculata]|uniref:putative F-box protein At3g16210 n=1 Tax=Andrographis paniculata TaxID=175694 RepID=UPI0021E8C9F9|nr:putative F-box protein At3g16210 [Andrographis paniculata]
MSDLCPLTDDLITEILIRLPVRSQLRSAAVCKLWYEIIKSSYFTNSHFRHESNENRLLVYRCHFMPTKKPANHDDNTFAIFQDDSLNSYDTPGQCHVPHVVWSLTGPCKGVFCVRSVNSQVALWNIATRRIRPLPDTNPRFFQRIEVGFGADPVTDEFKVVLIHCHDPYDLPMFAVYTSRADSWRCFRDETALGRDDGIRQARHGSTFLKGSYYWYKSNLYTGKRAVLAMDMHSEDFEEIEVPESVRMGVIDLHLWNDEYLGLSSCSNGDEEDSFVEIWVMKEKGVWTKMSSLSLDSRLQNVLGFWKGSGFFASLGWELVLCDMDSHAAIRNLEIPKKGGGYDLLWPFSYKESLFSVSEGYDGFEDYDIQSAESHSFFVKKPRYLYE